MRSSGNVRSTKMPPDNARTIPGAPAAVEPHQDVQRLMGHLRDANERLIVASVRAQNLVEEANAETGQARAEIENLLRQLADANERTAAAAAHAHVMADDARQREDEYRDLSGRLLQLQDEERRRLAVDLHDSMGQRVAALTMHLDLILSTNVALDAKTRQMLEENRSLADECSREVRTLAHLLYPPMLDALGLVSAVRWYVEGFTKRSGIHVSMNLDEVGRLPEPTETALYRVVQESLTNVHRHAAGASASIRLTRTADAVVLDIQDQGHGLRDRVTGDSAALSSQTLGVGIQGMRERVRQLGGTFDITFTNEGTTVRVGVPAGHASR